MAADAQTALDAAHSKPPEGVVLPPKEIRNIIEKTAGYVARNGPAFEERMRTRANPNDQKLSFLYATDPYHSFYNWRLSEVKAGRGTAVSAGRESEAIVPQQEMKKGPVQPPEFEFSARMPNINAIDLDVVQHTALFVAKNGKSWMTQLSQREAGNYQFDFLRPQHSLYQYFSRLVDQYTSLLVGDTEQDGKLQKRRIAELERNIKHRFHILERAKQRAAWVKHVDAQKVQKEEEAEAEKLAYAQIDWHDFTVVETVIFTEADDTADLQAPISLNDLQTASLEQKARISLQPHDMRIEEAMPMEEIYNYTPQPMAQQPPIPAPSTHSSYPQQAQYGPTPVSSGYANAPAPDQEDEDDVRIRERLAERERAQQAQAAARGQGPMRIRNDYIPRAQLKARQTATTMSMCPNCKQMIANEEMAEHMRIELLDPQWREQAAKAAARYSATNLSTADVANNLKRLASQRSDVFDPVTGQSITEEEIARRRRAANNAYDGGTDSRSTEPVQQTANVQEQIRVLHEKFARGGQRG
ncbi:SF3a splicing factor complex subunit [Elasticomyces elasticus]|nr:SF3a splicing factor complex subunit [Elasticomyces elasticus]